MAVKALNINNLSVNLGGKTVLEDISFQIDPGDFLIIIGPNGSGKTTLIKAVLNLVPHTGRVEIFGKPVPDINSYRGIAGYVPQKFDFDRTFPITVEEVITMAMGQKKWQPNRMKERVKWALDQVGMSSYADTKLGNLSGGQIQRVLIGRAIVNQPRIIFFDEPLAGVDVRGEKSFYQLINQLKENQGLTVVLISHDVTVVNLFADKVAALNRVLVGFGKPGDVLIPLNMEKVYGKGFGIFKHKECLDKPGPDLTTEDIDRCKLFEE